ncbi:hypothetical protein D9M68_963610 [compost metagenome]
MLISPMSMPCSACTRRGTPASAAMGMNSRAARLQVCTTSGLRRRNRRYVLGYRAKGCPGGLLRQMTLTSLRSMRWTNWWSASVMATTVCRNSPWGRLLMSWTTTFSRPPVVKR